MAQNTPQNNTNSIPFEQLKNEAGLIQLFKLFEEKLAYNVFNCVRVGIVEEYNPETRTAKIKIANKLVTGVNSDGTQKTQDYAPIYAKVWFFGWGDKGITHPILQGQEGILLFNDRELESWYINGNVNPLAYKRAHSMSDSIFICGLSSLPNVLANMQECINIFYGQNNIQINNSDINAKALSSINLNAPDVNVSGNLNVGTGVSAIVPCGGVTLTFSNGILTGVS